MLTEPESVMAGGLSGLMVISTVSPEVRRPSETVSSNVRTVWPATAGDSNDGESVSAPDRVMAGPEVWFHEYVMVWPSGSLDAVPFSVTVSPGRTVWPGPASAMGELFCRVDTLIGSDISDSPGSLMAMIKKT